MGTYTNEEIQSNINKLNTRIDQLKLQRTDITQNINHLKKQIEEWELLDTSQLKMFDEQ